MAFNPSKYQLGLFDFVRNGSGNAIIEAVAGSGKTTSLVEMLKLTDGSAIFLAFNKHIADVLKARVPSHVQARTFHSLCYSAVTRFVGTRQVNENKINQLIRSTLPENDVKIYGFFIRKLVSLARQVGAGCLCPLDSALLYGLVEQYDLVLESDNAVESTAIEYSQRILELSNKSTEVDFDDLLYFAVLKGIKLPTFDWVFVDEAQDTNAIQRAILRKILNKDGRLIAVGDAAQAIYGFRGADSNALELLASDFQPCARLPLSVTYRCAKSITELAQQYVPAIEPVETAEQGQVDMLDLNWKLTDFGSHDLIVCRNTKPLVDLGFRLMRAKIPLRVLGREIGEGLVALIRKCASGDSDIENMSNRLCIWRDREYQKAISKGLDGKAEAIDDKAETILMLVHDLPETERTIDNLIATINKLFTDQNSRITLSTIHKAKGLESDTVWWLCPSLCPSRWAKQEWQLKQEQNLMYVATTRAAKRLVMIELPKRGDQK